MERLDSIGRRNGMFNKENTKKVSFTLREKYASGEIIHPMKGKKRPDVVKRNIWNNPMKNKETIKKAKKSILKGYENGRINYFKGKKRWGVKEHPKGMLGKTHSKDYKDRLSIEMSGEKNPGWLGGKSFEPYDKNFNKKFKRLIRKRDNYICMKCGKHQEKEGRSLSVHHINYDKLLTIPQNCITLCNKCNLEVNSNREIWMVFFQSLLNKNYNYEYSSNKEVIVKYK